MEAGKWIALRGLRPSPKLRLFCLPYSGGGAGLFREWANILPETIEVCPIELPGRGTRRSEQPAWDLHALTRSMADGLASLISPSGPPIALFGVSMGALAGFELARELRRRNKEPAVLLVASQNAPRVVARRNRSTSAPRRHLLSDEEFVSMLRRGGRVPEAVIDSPRLMRLFGPLIRADHALVDAYDYEPEPPLGCPMHLLVGEEDATLSEDDLTDWRSEASGVFEVHRLPGSHFFFEEDRKGFLAVVSSLLRGLG